VTINDRLAAAAAALGSMPAEEVKRQLQRLEDEHRRRGDIGRARHSADIDAVHLDWAAYQLAREHDDAGDLAAAVRWYRMAAVNDFSDAALRLGKVFERLAIQHAERHRLGHHASRHEELRLVSEAARWYAEAYGAGHPEAAGLLDAMIGQHDPGRPPATVSRPGPVPPTTPAGAAAPPCARGGLAAVVSGNDLSIAIAHFRLCTLCQREFVRSGGILPALTARSGPSAGRAPGRAEDSNPGARCVPEESAGRTRSAAPHATRWRQPSDMKGR